MTKAKRTIDDLNDELKTQINFLLKSCNVFDQGDISEAKRISTTLRTLLKDKGTSKSLLGQLNLKANFWSYAHHLSGKIIIQQNYLVRTLDNQIHPYQPNFLYGQDEKYFIPFEVWWQEVVITDMSGRLFSREKIILSVAEQDGGTHVDPTIDDDYFKLTRENSQSNYIIEGDFSNGLPASLSPELLKPMAPPVWHTIRQIAHEVLATLEVDYDYNPEPFYRGLAISGFALE